LVNNIYILPAWVANHSVEFASSCLLMGLPYNKAD